MKFKLLLGALGLAVFSAGAIAGPNVAVSVNIGDPNFYGRIDIGNVPAPPVLVYDQPVVVVQRPVRPRPIYLRVPPGHEKHWSKHCGKYNACGQPVYFVQDRWYQEHYARGGDRRDRRDDRRDGRRDDRYDDRHDDRHDKHHGKGHGKDHGKGHDKGHGKGHGRD